MDYLMTGGETPLMDKLQILTDAAKYDVACTSSGVDRRGNGRALETVWRRVSATAFPATGDASLC